MLLVPGTSHAAERALGSTHAPGGLGEGEPSLLNGLADLLARGVVGGLHGLHHHHLPSEAAVGVWDVVPPAPQARARGAGHLVQRVAGVAAVFNAQPPADPSLVELLLKKQPHLVAVPEPLGMNNNKGHYGLNYFVSLLHYRRSAQDPRTPGQSPEQDSFLYDPYPLDTGCPGSCEKAQSETVVKLPSTSLRDPGQPLHQQAYHA